MTRDTVYRSREEYALYNPAFLSTLCRRAVDGAQAEHRTSLPIPTLFVAVGLALTPRVLSEGKPNMRSHLSAWLDQDAGRVFEIQEHLPSLTTPIAAGIRFAVAFQLLSIQDGAIIAGHRSLAPMKPAQSRSTYETERMAYFFGRWLPKAGPAESVLSTLRLQV